MKKYCNLFVLCILLASFSQVYGQARVDLKDITFSQRSGRLYHATGWKLNTETSKWVSHPNAIDERTYFDDAAEDFTWIQTASFFYGGQKYFILYYLQPSGDYKYPINQLDWYKIDEMDFNLMTLGQYVKFLRSLDKFDGKVTNIDFQLESKQFVNQESGIYNKITKTLVDNNGKIDNKSSMSISAQIVNGTKVVRFNLLNSILIDGFDNKVPLSKAYFEVDPISFKSLFIPLTPAEMEKGDIESVREDSLKKVAEHSANSDAYEHNSNTEVSASMASIAEAKKKAEEDSVNKIKDRQDKVSGWQTSDTLYFSKCKKIDRMGFIKHPFSWAAISSFKSDGETKYCLYYEAMNSLDQQHISFLVLDQQKYISLKEAVNKKEGVTLSVGSTIFNSSKSPVNLPDAIYQDMTNQYHFSIEACLTVNVTKKKIQFLLPEFGGCERHPDFSEKGSFGHYECDLEVFAKLLKWP